MMKKGIFSFFLLNIMLSFIYFNSQSEYNYEAVYEECNSNYSVDDSENKLINEKHLTETNSIPDDCNIIEHDLETGTTYYRNMIDTLSYSNNTYSSPFASLDDQNNLRYNFSDLSLVENTQISPYKYVARIVTCYYNIWNNVKEKYENVYRVGSGSAIEKHCVLSCAHVVYGDPTTGDYDDGIANKRFPDKIQIQFATYYDEDTGQRIYPHGKIDATEIFVKRQYVDDSSTVNDWSVITVDENLSTELGGYFSRASGYNFLNQDVEVYGYPSVSNLPINMYEETGNVFYHQDGILKVYGFCTGGMSGSPIIGYINNSRYVIGIVTSKIYNSNTGNVYYFQGPTMNYMLFDVINLIAQRYEKLQIRDLYYDGTTKLRYNTFVKMIYNIESDEQIQFSNNASTVSKIGYTGVEIYSSQTSSTYMDFPYTYYRIYNSTNNSYTSWKNIANTFSEQSRTAKYETVNKTSINGIIYTSFDQSTNVWYHHGSSGNIIRGTIAYNGKAKNIEVSIPSNGTNLSETVIVNNVSFQLRCGPYRVSIKASQNVTCDNLLSMFSFGVSE